MILKEINKMSKSGFMIYRHGISCISIPNNNKTGQMQKIWFLIKVPTGLWAKYCLKIYFELATHWYLFSNFQIVLNIVLT
jgi:hypothetical protein